MDQLRVLTRPGAAWCAVIAAFALTVIGIMAIDTVDAGSALKQSRQWLPIALLVFAMCVLPHPRQISMASGPILVIMILLLLLMAAPGVPRWLVTPNKGATRWINLHFMMFQPSELAKIAFVLAVARYLRFRDNYRTLWGMLVPFAIMLLPMGLIVKQPDLGTALLFPPALFAVLLAAGAKLRHLGALVALGVLVVALNVAAIYALPKHPVLKPHQVNRIKAVISQAQGDDRYVQTIGYQQHQAIMLVAAGQTSGYGAERSGSLIRFNWLPESHNDMIFVVIANRWGAIGGLAVLGLFFVLMTSLVVIAGRAKDPFVRLATVGFAALLFSQATINIAMSIGLVPITGMTLPFVSYGGSSLVATFAMLGLVVNFASRRPVPMTRPSFEFGRPQRVIEW
jgi:rod shape determining protein RodA